MSSKVWELDSNQPPTCSYSKSYAIMMRKGMKKKNVFGIMFSS